MNKVFNQFLQKIQKDNVSLCDVQEVNTYIANLNAKNSTKRMYAYAVKQFYKETNIFNKLVEQVIDYKQDKNLELKALEYCEIQTIKEYLDKDENKLLINFIFNALLETGMRISEFISIDWMNQDDECVIVKTLKNIDEYRYTFISKQTLEKLNKLKKQNNVLEKLINKKYIQNKFIDISNKLNIQFSCHTLRRTCGTLLKMNGVDIDDIATCLGHKNLNNTIQYYVKTNKQYQHNISKLGWTKPINSLEINKQKDEILYLKKEIILKDEIINQLKNEIKKLKGE